MKPRPPDSLPRPGAPACPPPSRATATARTSQALTDRPSAAAAPSARPLRWREAEVDPDHGAVVALRGGRRGHGGSHDRLPCLPHRLGRRRRCHHELGIEPAQPYVDRAGSQLPGDVAHGRGEHVEQGQPGGGLQGSTEPLGEGTGFVTAGIRGDGEFPPEVVDVGGEVHDAIMAHGWRHVEPIWHAPPRRTVLTCENAAAEQEAAPPKPPLGSTMASLRHQMAHLRAASAHPAPTDQGGLPMGSARVDGCRTATFPTE
ncbi:hypothetical protein GA0115253_1024215 [Streptomyces sp. Termitarium-T10T-6]|nr:hypothetical protein GA0115253_1024215 [Streptomyces sp. Termitarium-T10T-6]